MKSLAGLITYKFKDSTQFGCECNTANLIKNHFHTELAVCAQRI